MESARPRSPLLNLVGLASRPCALALTVLAFSSATAECEAQGAATANQAPDNPQLEIEISSCKDGQWERAIKGLTEVLARDPKEIRAFRWRAAAYLAVGRWNEAIADCTRLISLDPNDAALYLNRAEGYRGKRDFRQALDDATRGLQLNPTNSQAYMIRASIHAGNRDFGRAVADVTSALQLNPRDARALCLRGWYRCFTCEYDYAVADYRNAVRLDSSFHKAWNGLAWLLATCPSAPVRSGPGAVAAATKACSLTGWSNWDYLDTLAAAHAEAGDFKQAADMQRRALAIPGATDDECDEMKRHLSLYLRGSPNHEGQWH